MLNITSQAKLNNLEGCLPRCSSKNTYLNSLATNWTSILSWPESSSMTTCSLLFTHLSVDISQPYLWLEPITPTDSTLSEKLWMLLSVSRMVSLESQVTTVFILIAIRMPQDLGRSITIHGKMSPLTSTFPLIKKTGRPMFDICFYLWPTPCNGPSSSFIAATGQVSNFTLHITTMISRSCLNRKTMMGPIGSWHGGNIYCSIYSSTWVIRSWMSSILLR